MEELNQPITEAWLSASGFRWHQLDRQPSKQWLLWLGSAIEEGLTSVEDLGVEVSRTGRAGDDSEWHCWLRRDTAGRYSRFLHIRHLTCRGDLIRLIGGITGVAWNPENHLDGSMYTEQGAQRVRQIHNRLDHQVLLTRPKWNRIEEDDTRGRALPEHAEEAVKRGGAQ